MHNPRSVRPGSPPPIDRRRRNRRRVRLAAGLAAVLALAAACGDDDDVADEAPPASSSAETTSAPIGTGTTDPTDSSGPDSGSSPVSVSGSTEVEGADDGDLSAPASEYDPEGVIRFGYALSPSQGLDPHKTSLAQDTVWLAPLYDPLIIEMPDSTLVPGLATEWEFVDDNAALQLTLRDGVTFHDGTPFDAQAVKTNLERAKTVEGSAVASLISVIDSVEIVDPLTVKLLLNGPAATLPRLLADRPGMMISPAAIDDPDLAEHPVGTGMYRIEEYRVGDRAVMVPFEDYWNPEWVKLARLEIVAQADALTRLNGLRSGELDLAELDPQTFDVARSASLSTEEFFTVSQTYLHLNRTRSEFGNELARQALSYAIDRQAILEAVQLGYGRASSQFYPPEFTDGYVEGLDDRYAYDPEKARQLLAEAGLEDGFSFDVVVPTLARNQAIAQILQAEFAEIGVTANLVSIDASQVASSFFNDEIGDMVVGGTPGRTDPTMVTQLFIGDANSNPGGGALPEVEALYAEALVPRPEAERIPIFHELMTAFTETVGAIWLMTPTTLIAGDDDVAGFHWSLRGQPDFRGAGIAAG